MHDKDLYARILGIQLPWRVTEVALRLEAGEVHVRLAPDRTAFQCPTCGEESPGYDTRERQWRHLDTCQYRTIVLAQVPRVQCPRHGVGQVVVPWAEAGARFTALFEALVIDWLREASLAAVGRQLQLSWDEVDGILSQAVARGLARRAVAPPRRIGVDETAFQKRPCQASSPHPTGFGGYSPGCCRPQGPGRADLARGGRSCSTMARWVASRGLIASPA